MAVPFKVDAAVVAEIQQKFPACQHHGRRHQLFLLLEEPTSGTLAWLYMVVMTGLIFFSVVTTALETTEDAAGMSDALLEGGWVDVGLNLIFTLELALRFAVSHQKRTFFTSRDWRITQEHFFNLVDLGSVLPFYLEFIFSEDFVNNNKVFQVLTTMRPTLRLLKVCRNFSGFSLLVRCIDIALPQLPVPLFLLFTLVLFFGSLIWEIEGKKNTALSPAVSTIPSAMWFSVVSVSTVGYGDVKPTTDTSKILAAVLIIIGILYMAVPLTVVGNAFEHVWANRALVDTLHKARRRLRIDAIDALTFEQIFVDVAERRAPEIPNRPHTQPVLDALGFVILLRVVGITFAVRRLRFTFNFLDEEGLGYATFRQVARTLYSDEDLSATNNGLRLDLTDHDDQVGDTEKKEEELPTVDSLRALLNAINQLEQDFDEAVHSIQLDLQTFQPGAPVPKLPDRPVPKVSSRGSPREEQRSALGATVGAGVNAAAGRGAAALSAGAAAAQRAAQRMSAAAGLMGVGLSNVPRVIESIASSPSAPSTTRGSRASLPHLLVNALHGASPRPSQAASSQPSVLSGAGVQLPVEAAGQEDVLVVSRYAAVPLRPQSARGAGTPEVSSAKSRATSAPALASREPKPEPAASSSDPDSRSSSLPAAVITAESWPPPPANAVATENSSEPAPDSPAPPLHQQHHPDCGSDLEEPEPESLAHDAACANASVVPAEVVTLVDADTEMPC
mmetsp:Transcript_92188/g.246474  ORF Transcript_92188/g.246474 Transcript_92188/m.246474 type:complete len:731 (-) Transcript_92188:99-2291(-)